MLAKYSLDDAYTPEPITAPVPTSLDPCYLSVELEPFCHFLDLRHTPLYANLDTQRLLHTFSLCPQFDAIDAPAVLDRSMGKLRVILIGEDPYYRQQAALYLSSINCHPATPKTEDKFWKNQDITSVVQKKMAIVDDDDDMVDLSKHLLVVDSAFIKPEQHSELVEQQPKPKRLREFPDCGALLLESKKGVLFQDEIIGSLLQCKDSDLYLSISTQQIDHQWLSLLQVRHHFQVCYVGPTTDQYLDTILRYHAKNLTVTLDENLDTTAVFQHLRRQLQGNFNELDVQAAVKRQLLNTNQQVATTQDLCLQSKCTASIEDPQIQLNQLAELTTVKQAIAQLLATKKVEEKRMKAGLSITPRHHHMAFSGPPGTGKTVTAQLLARILQKHQVGSGRFVEAGRQDLVGKYLGQTAPKVSQLFDTAKGGVLFIDEIGALSNADEDYYANEAINALVYHMDRCPETIVIFATYTKEMEDFLDSNSGLASRISANINFPSYNTDTLLQILDSSCTKQGYTMTDTARRHCADYLVQARQQNPFGFGNGREVRRLLDGTFNAQALRTCDEAQLNPVLEAEDVLIACKQLVKPTTVKRTVGFAS